jgi:ubiquinol-cytochrome c reductase cytochrome b subunit
MIYLKIKGLHWYCKHVFLSLIQKSIWFKNTFIKIIGNLVVYLPSRKRLSYNWNFGSILGIILIIQIITGIFLSFFYAPNVNISFDSLRYIIRDINYGWFIRIIHLNFASFFFLFIYLHIARGLYYVSFRLAHTWFSGITIYLLLIATAFIGYVLPWGQMSLWGATVITNFLSTIPILGETIVKWVWGGFSVNNSTLNCFFSLHFLLPFILLVIVIIHLIFLHYTGSTSPNSGTFRHIRKIKFDNYYVYKDLINIVFIFIIIFITLWSPFAVGDPENFILANPINSPIHIQPEWYFLYVYGILRSIPNKLGGVIVIVIALVIFYFLVVCKKLVFLNSIYIFKSIFIIFINCFFLLTWIGSQAVERPFIYIGQVLTFLYFLYFFWIFLYSERVNNLLNLCYTKEIKFLCAKLH